jgi:hypothetical protein
VTACRLCADGRPVFVSDNPAFDFQWINHGFWHALRGNPFGHSGRRIGDYYAGLVGDFRRPRTGSGAGSRHLTTIQ